MNNKCDKSIQNSKIKEDRVETIFFIPYIGLPSIIFSRKLKELFKKYYCKTIRHLATRVKEHGTSPSPSAVSNHLSSCETCKLNFSCDNFSMIDSGKNDFEITIKEALHIKFKKPTINRQLFSQGWSFVLNVF